MISRNYQKNFLHGKADETEIAGVSIGISQQKMQGQNFVHYIQSLTHENGSDLRVLLF